MSSPSTVDGSKPATPLHAHTQVLGKLSAALAPPEPRFQHLAARLTAGDGRRRRCPLPSARERWWWPWTCGVGASLPGPAGWDAQPGGYLLDWNEVCPSPDPRTLALEFWRSVFRHACEAGAWDRAPGAK